MSTDNACSSVITQKYLYTTRETRLADARKLWQGEFSLQMNFRF